MDPYLFGVSYNVGPPQYAARTANHSQDERYNGDYRAPELMPLERVVNAMLAYNSEHAPKAEATASCYRVDMDKPHSGAVKPSTNGETLTWMVYAHLEHPDKKYDLGSKWRVIPGPWDERPKSAPYDEGGIPYRGLERVVDGIYQLGIKVNLEHIRRTAKTCQEALLDIWLPLQHAVHLMGPAEPMAFVRGIKREISAEPMRTLNSLRKLDSDAQRTLLAYSTFDRYDVDKDAEINKWMAMKKALDPHGGDVAEYVTDMLERIGAIPKSGGPKPLAPVPRLLIPFFFGHNLD